MELENIHLTAQQLEEFYSSHLVITNAETNKNPLPKEKAQLTGITGKNNKNFVWVVNEPDYPFLVDEDFLFMSEVITACRMNMDDIALVNLAKSNFNFTEMKETLQPKFIILSALAQNWLEADSYSLQQQEGFQFYITEELSILRNDKIKKSKLWLALKQMLGL